jgi:FKBP-type peptidyl-prolyl cis-trans isomerase
MIKFIIGALIFGLIALAIIVLVVINFTYKSFRQLRKAAEDQFELHQRRKEQKEKNPFGDDYFKSTDGPQQQNRQRRQQSGGQQTAKENTARRTTTTSSGVTIIDEREADKKIFSHDDGEYVEFEEV